MRRASENEKKSEIAATCIQSSLQDMASEQLDKHEALAIVRITASNDALDEQHTLDELNEQDNHDAEEPIRMRC